MAQRHRRIWFLLMGAVWQVCIPLLPWMGAALVILPASSAHAAVFNGCTVGWGGTQPGNVILYTSGQSTEPFTVYVVSAFQCSSDSPYGFRPCTSADAATSTGSGGSTVSPYRQARSASGNTINFQLYNQTGTIPLTADNLQLNGTGFTSSTTSATVTQNSVGTAVRLVVPALQSVPPGDYYANVPLTIKVQYVASGSAPTCTSGTTVYSAVMTYQVHIRVGGGGCDFTFNSGARLIDMGLLAASGGSLVSTSSTGSVRVVCETGLAWTLSFSDGLSPSGTGPYRRRMAKGSSYISYGIFADAGLTTEFTASSTGTGGAGGVTGAILVYFGIPSQSTSALTAGTHRDTVNAVVTY